MNALKTRLSDTSLFRAWIGDFSAQNPYLCMGKSQQIFRIFILWERIIVNLSKK